MGAEPAERERRALLGILTLGGLRGRLGRACRQRPGPHLRLARFSAWASLPSWVSLRLELLVAEHSDDGTLGRKDQALILVLMDVVVFRRRLFLLPIAGGVLQSARLPNVCERRTNVCEWRSPS